MMATGRFHAVMSESRIRIAPTRLASGYRQSSAVSPLLGCQIRDNNQRRADNADEGECIEFHRGSDLAFEFCQASSLAVIDGDCACDAASQQHALRPNRALHLERNQL